MKKLIIIALSLSIFACSTKDDPQPKSVIQPPVTVTSPIVTVTTTVLGVTPEKPKVDTTLPQSVDYKMYIGSAAVQVKAPFEYVPASQIHYSNYVWESSDVSLKFAVPCQHQTGKLDSIFLTSSFDVLTEKDKNRPVYYTQDPTVYAYFKSVDSLVLSYNEHGPFDKNSRPWNSTLTLQGHTAYDGTNLNVDINGLQISGIYFTMPVSSTELYDPNGKTNYTEYYVAFVNCSSDYRVAGVSEWSINFNYPGLKGYK